MRSADWGATIGWIAVVVGVLGTGAQWRRLRREGLEGVSVATWSLFVYLGAYWIAYGIAERSWTITMGSLLMFPLQVGVLRGLKPWRAPRASWSALSFFVVSCLVPAALWGWSGGIYGTTITMTVTRLPQLVELVRRAGAAGVSTGMWLLGAIGSGLWVVYYAQASRWAAFTATLVSGAVSAVIAALALWRHRTSDPARDVLSAVVPVS